MSSAGPIANLLGSSQAAGSKIPQHVLVVDGSGNPVTFGGSGGTSETDSASFTATVTLGTPAMGAFETTPDTLTSGQLGILALDTNRNLKVNVAAGGTAGTQYTEGDTDASITGTALMLEGAANTLVAAPGTAADGMLVNLGGNNDVTVTGTVTISGTVTANAGTNLNTSALALESGGNLAAAVTALQIIDDWDETDRAKVNLIVGQAGVAAGAGAVGASTQRVTLASDDPAVASLSVLDDWDESDRAKVNLIVGQAGVAAGAGASGATTQRVILATDGQPGAGTFATNQVSVASTATLIVAARSGRRSVGVMQHGTTAVYLGPTNGVTTSNGLLLPGTAGAGVTLDYSGDVYGIVASGTQTVSYGEEY